MAEVTFARAFLSLLDSRPVKLPAEFVEDPRKYPARPPYTLPLAPVPPYSRPSSAVAGPPGSAPATPTISVTLKAMKHPITLSSSFPLATTSVLDLKAFIAAEISVPVDKMKILHTRKPVADSKVLSDLVKSVDEKEIELSFMLNPGVVPSAKKTDEEARAADESANKMDIDEAAEEVVETEAFWTDLQGFLLQRLKNEGRANEVFAVFKGAWEKR